MTKKILLLAVILSVTTAAHASKQTFEAFKVDWTTGNAQQGGVLLCDDSGPFAGIEITVEGDRNSFEYSIEKGSDAKVQSVRETHGRNGQVETVITILSGDGLVIDFQQKSTGAVASVDEGDAC